MLFFYTDVPVNGSFFFITTEARDQVMALVHLPTPLPASGKLSTCRYFYTWELEYVYNSSFMKQVQEYMLYTSLMHATHCKLLRSCTRRRVPARLFIALLSKGNGELLLTVSTERRCRVGAESVLCIREPSGSNIGPGIPWFFQSLPPGERRGGIWI
jgi:hypothetical protein